MPKVSVIIPTFNCAQYLPQAIDSVLSQSYPDFEIIIIDDGSTDGTRVVVQKYLDSHKSKIKYIFHENRGLACARNTGIKNAEGEYLALLDADDIWLPAHLAVSVEVLNSYPEVGIVHANIFCIDEEGKILFEARRDKRNLNGRIAEALLLKKAEISCPTTVFRKSCIDEVGIFDENLARLGSEDRDLWIRITSKFTAFYIDKPLACYRLRPGSMSKDVDKMLKAKQYVINKFCLKNKGLFFIKARALSRLYKDSADVLLFQRRFGRAGSLYWQSILTWPLSFWPWVNLLKALLCIPVKNIIISE